MHTEWLHGHLYEFVEGAATASRYAISRNTRRSTSTSSSTASTSAACSTAQSEDSDDWKVGHPVVFPNILAVGSGGGDLWKMYTYQIRVPIDDTHTLHYWYTAYVPPPGVGCRSTCSTASRSTTSATATRTASRCSTSSTRRTSWRGSRRDRSRKRAARTPRHDRRRDHHVPQHARARDGEGRGRAGPDGNVFAIPPRTSGSSSRSSATRRTSRTASRASCGAPRHATRRSPRT